MSAALSPPQQQLLSVIQSSQQPETRVEAEKQLDQYASSFPGFASLLCSLLAPSLAESVVPPGLATLAAILLKLYIQRHWSEVCEPFEPPVVSDGEKAQLHASLLHLLSHPVRGVRKQLAAVIAEVAEFDFPERWTNLLPDIISILQQAQGNDSAISSNLLLGSLEVLVSFCEEMTDQQLTSTIPQLFPMLLSLCDNKFSMLRAAQDAMDGQGEMSDAQKAALDEAMQFCIYALQVYQSCCASLLNINELVNAESKGKKGAKKGAAPTFDQILTQFLQPTLTHWLSFLSSILTVPATPGSLALAQRCPLVWALRLEATKTLIAVVEKFEPHFLSLGVEGAEVFRKFVDLSLDTATAVWPLYTRRVLNARLDSEDSEGEDGADEDEAEEDAFDAEGNAINMSSFLFELFMFIKVVLTIRQPKKAGGKKGGKKGKAAQPQAPDQKQLAYQHLKAYFSGPVLQRLLQLSLQYLQLSSIEISASLGHIEDFLSFQQLDIDSFAGQKVNVRNGVKELLLDCILCPSEDDDGMAAEEAAQLAEMGFEVPELSSGASQLLDRPLVIRTLCPLLSSLLHHSLSLRSRTPTGDRHWWKGREVATLVVAFIVDDIQALNTPPKNKKKAATHQPVQFDLAAFVREVLIPDLDPAAATAAAASGLPPVHTLLRTQALHATSYFGPVFEKANESQLLLLALEALVANMSPQANSDLVVRISAVHAFGSLCSSLNNKALLTHNNLLVHALQNICQLVHAASTASASSAAAAASEDKAETAIAADVDESALLKVLETLLMALSVDEATTVSAEPTLTPLLLSAWSANATKPSISDSIVDILETLLNLSPVSCTSIQVRVLPVLEQIFQQNQVNQAVTGTVAAALDLLKFVLLSVEKHTRNQQAEKQQPTSPSTAPSAAPEFLHPLLFSSLLPLTLTLLLHTDDHSLIEVGTTVLTAYLRINAQAVASAQLSVVLPGSAAGSAPTPLTGLQLLCTLINQLLNPALDDKVAHNVGNLIVQLVFSLGSVLGENNVKELIKAVVARLHSSHYPPLTESLLLIFARLIHSSGVESIVGFLASLGSIPVLEKKLVPVKKNATDKYTSMLKTELTPTTVEALPYLLTKWMSAQSEVHASYPSKVMYLALAKLLTFLFQAGSEAMRNMECKGYVVQDPKAKGKRVTRSQTAATGGKGHEPTYNKIPLSTKVLQLLLTEWREWEEKEQLRQKKEAKKMKRIAKLTGQAGAEDYDEEDEEEDWEDEEDDEFDDDEDFDDDDDDAFIAKMIANKGSGGGSAASPFADADDYPDFGGPSSKGGQQQYLTLSDMLDNNMDDFNELDEEIESEVYPESLTDPINQVELGPFLTGFFQEFAQAQQGKHLQEAAQYLDQNDQKVLEQTLHKQAAAANATPKKQ